MFVIVRRTLFLRLMNVEMSNEDKYFDEMVYFQILWLYLRLIGFFREFSFTDVRLCFL